MPGHFSPYFGQFALQGFDFLLNFGNIDFRLLLEGVDIAGDIEVELVLLNLLEGRPEGASGGAYLGSF